MDGDTASVEVEFSDQGVPSISPGLEEYDVDAEVDEFDADVDDIEQTTIDQITVEEQQAELSIEDFSGELPDSETEEVDLEDVEVTISEEANVEAENVGEVRATVFDGDGVVATQELDFGSIEDDQTETFFSGGNSVDGLEADAYEVTVTAEADNSAEEQRTESFTVEEADNWEIISAFVGGFGDDSQIRINFGEIGGGPGGGDLLQDVEIDGDEGDLIDAFEFDPDEELENDPQLESVSESGFGQIDLFLDDDITLDHPDPIENALSFTNGDAEDDLVAQSDGSLVVDFEDEDVRND